MRVTNVIRAKHLYILDVRWFGYTGIILIWDDILKEYKSYIKNVYDILNGNENENEDIQKIARAGHKFPIKAAAELFEIDISEDPWTNIPEEFL